MNIKYENVKAAMDVLSTLLGYNGIDELVLSKSGQTPIYATSEDETQKFEEPKVKAHSKDNKKPKKVVPRDEAPRKKVPTKPKKVSKPRANQHIPHEEESEDDGYTPYQTEYGKSGYKAPGMNKRFAHQSYSPKRQHVQHYQEDFSDLAVSKKIHFNPRVNKEKMEEAEFLRN